MNFQEAPHGEYTDQMRSYGLYLHRTGRQEILFDALRGFERDDDAFVPLRAPRLRRKGVAGDGLAAAGAGSWRFRRFDWSLPPSPFGACPEALQMPERRRCERFTSHPLQERDRWSTGRFGGVPQSLPGSLPKGPTRDPSDLGTRLCDRRADAVYLSL